MVSSVNGHLEDMKRLSDLAHAHGALLYAAVIQGVSAISIDVKTLGIDRASTAMYKWLTGEHGFGFPYVDEKLVGSRIKQTLLDGHPDYNYPPWKERRAGVPDFVNHRSSGLDCGTPSVITYAAQHEWFAYIEKIGIPN